MNLQPAAEATRGETVESIHFADIVVVEATDEGQRLVASFGNADAWCFPRSSLKPLQAWGSYQCGLAKRLGITPDSRFLAIMSASHGSTPKQRQAVLDLLELAGLDESDLRCGYHPPASAEGRAALAERGGQPSPVDGNCSGKHAGMLAACVAQGWPIEDYHTYDHPCQQQIRKSLKQLLRTDEHLPWGIDGCGLPTYQVPMQAMAGAFARLTDDPSADEPPAPIGLAMRAHPELLGDPDGFNVKLMQACPGVIAKSGAEAAFCFSLPAKRLGVVVKILDGSARATGPIVVSILRQLEALSGAELERLGPCREAVVKSLAGDPAGVIRATLKLRFA